MRSGAVFSADPVGPGNDAALHNFSLQESLTVAGWGVHGAHQLRAGKVETDLAMEGIALHCLGLTKDGWPKHPLYLRRDCWPELYRPAYWRPVAA